MFPFQRSAEQPYHAYQQGSKLGGTRKWRTQPQMCSSKVHTVRHCYSQDEDRASFIDCQHEVDFRF